VRAERYLGIEAGHAAQNVYLQATARGLGTTLVGAFDDTTLRAVLDLPPALVPLAVLPVGHPR
jgi:nitroreductase